jgi:hypothetical protein
LLALPLAPPASMPSSGELAEGFPSNVPFGFGWPPELPVVLPIGPVGAAGPATVWPACKASAINAIAAVWPSRISAA